MTAYYNEIDPKAAAWLRELIKRGLIADGVVDERSIIDVSPDELRDFTQCHFFAGIGVWSYALRSAGWADDRPVWTGSCPCQPFSAAGRRGGVDDERHLWPHWHHLISQCQPTTIFGEQVASKDGLGWLDLVCADMEATGYAIGAADLCAAGVGAPHIRQRLFFGATRLADAGCDSARSQLGDRAKAQGVSQAQWKPEQRADVSDGRSAGGDGCGIHGGDGVDASRLADADSGQRGRLADGEGRQPDRPQTGRQQGDSQSECSGAGIGLADAADAGFQIGRGGSGQQPGSVKQPERLFADGGLADANDARSQGRPGVPERPDERAARAGSLEGGLGDPRGPAGERDAGSVPAAQEGEHGARVTVDGPEPVGLEHAGSGMASRPSTPDLGWSSADWLFCRDGKWRPVEPGTFPLAHGSAQRVGRLRGYGNAIVAQVAQTFVESMMDAMK